MRKCIYCNNPANSQEHTLSEGVVEELIKSIPNIHRASSSMGKKFVGNLETIGDVCRKCNSDLSIYDVAGIKLVKEIKGMLDPQSQKITFDENTLGWLIKTICNFIRTHQGSDKNVASEIYKHLIEHKCLDSSLVRIRLLAMSCDSDPFIPNSNNDPTLPLQFAYVFYIAELNVFRVMFYLRNIQFEIIVGQEGNTSSFITNLNLIYKKVQTYFGGNYQRLSIENCLDKGFIKFHNILPIETCTKRGPKSEFFNYMEGISY